MIKDVDPKLIEGEFFARSETDISSLLPDLDDPHYLSPDSHVRAFYFDYATRPLATLVKKWGEKVEIAAVFSGLRGIELQTMFYLAAPSKRYGVDHHDTLDDWRQLYQDPSNINRLKLHKRIPNWDIFENYREELRQLIFLDYSGYQDKIDTVHPVMRLRINEGNVSWSFDELDKDTIMSNGASIRLIPALGPLVVAAYSRQVTSTWGEELNYHLEAASRGAQDMGSTQAFPLTLAMADTLLDTSFVQNLVSHCRK